MKRHYYTVFALLVFALLLTLGLVLRKEMNPEWKKYQEDFFRKERKQALRDLAGADEIKRVKLQRRLTYLERPRYRIRQIFLKDGNRVDRCITCHLDVKQLENKHPDIERFPFEQYGCTVCHGGIGRATEISMAHSTLRIPPRPLYEYLQAHATGTSTLDLFQYTASGRPIPFTGSVLCLRCHLSSHPRHVARWRKLKFRPLDKVRTKLKELSQSGLAAKESQCLGCHTTGFNPGTGRYLEDRVTCESCHGPGGFYSDLMAGGRARDGAELARTNILKTDADRVCLNCHRPDRHKDYLGEDTSPPLIAAYLGAKPTPDIDGVILDDAWNTALETRVFTWQLDGSSPRPGPTVSIRAVYDDARIYFSFRWPDKSFQDRMGHWVFTGKSWQPKVEWPDALALHWQATAKVADFKQGGCAVLCHSTGRFKKFPRMATREADALVDEWYWNAFTTPRTGRPGDGFLDNRTEFIPTGRPKPPLAGDYPEVSIAHGSDESGARMPQNRGGIPLVLNEDVTEVGRISPRFYVEDGRRVLLQLSEGAQPTKKVLPLYITGTPETGDSADLRGKASWSEGYWVLELSRALQTTSKRDVQFDPSQKSTTFGLAVWDGAAGDKHSVATQVRLLFEPSQKTE